MSIVMFKYGKKRNNIYIRDTHIIYYPLFFWYIIYEFFFSFLTFDTQCAYLTTVVRTIAVFIKYCDQIFVLFRLQYYLKSISKNIISLYTTHNLRLNWLIKCIIILTILYHTYYFILIYFKLPCNQTHRLTF